MWTRLALLALIAPSFQGAVMRFGCSSLKRDRIDPLVNPGVTPSPHMHQIVGGNAFSSDIPVTDVAKLATCTTCSFAEDLSNYWTANMYFRAPNNTYKRVPQKPNRFLNGANEGITVYYVAPYDGSQVTAFQAGFRMLTGDVMNRDPSKMGRANCMRCYTGENFGGDIMAPCADPDRDFKGFPPHQCPGGIRSNIEFPTCWDGKNLDSSDHRSHVAFASGNTFGPCPDTHPVRIPQIFLEVVWDTTEFNKDELWPKDGQPFVLSYNDATGAGQHADYVFGWKDDSLQKALDSPRQQCTGATCSALTTQPYTEANKCVQEQEVEEDADGWMTFLPGFSDDIDPATKGEQQM